MPCHPNVVNIQVQGDHLTRSQIDFEVISLQIIKNSYSIRVRCDLCTWKGIIWQLCANVFILFGIVSLALASLNNWNLNSVSLFKWKMAGTASFLFRLTFLFLVPLFRNDGLSTTGVEGNPDAKRLYDDLLSHYNRLIRPVSNNSQVVTVGLGLHLTQLIDLVCFFFFLYVCIIFRKSFPIGPVVLLVIYILL